MELGRVIGGTYRVERVLGEGGMGAVYEVTHLRTGRLHAMKTLRPAKGDDREKAVARFRREAEAVGKLGHANVIAIHDFDEEDGLVYLVMDKLEGEDLEARLAREAPLSVDAALRIFRDVLAGVGAAHAAGILHRDLKPGNIFLARMAGAPERAVVLDFGLAKTVSPDDAKTKLTASGIVVGTPRYMAPEQAAGAELDPRTDLHALGMILFEMLTGQVPYDGKSIPALFAQITTQPPPAITGFRPDLPPALNGVIGRALAKRKEDRHADVEALLADVETALGLRDAIPATVESGRSEEPFGADMPATRAVPSTATRARRSPVLLVLGILVGVIGTATVLALFLPTPAEAPGESAPEPQAPVAPVVPLPPDAGPSPEPDAGPACDSVLGCLQTCDAILDTITLEEDFEDGPGPLRRMQGNVDAAGGDLRVGGTRSISASLASPTLPTTGAGAALCADAFLPAMAEGARRYEAVVGLRTRHRGASFNLRGTDHRVGLLELGPRVTPVDRDDCPWIGEAHEVRLLLVLTGDWMHAEVQRLDTGELCTLGGPYGGPSQPVGAGFEMQASPPFLIHEVRAGRPSDRALELLAPLTRSAAWLARTPFCVALTSRTPTRAHASLR